MCEYDFSSDHLFERCRVLLFILFEGFRFYFNTRMIPVNTIHAFISYIYI